MSTIKGAFFVLSATGYAAVGLLFLINSIVESRTAVGIGGLLGLIGISLVWPLTLTVVGLAMLLSRLQKDRAGPAVRSSRR